MKKVSCWFFMAIIFSLIFLIPINSEAADNPRWIHIGGFLYYDSQTVEYDSNTHHLKYWLRWKNGYTPTIMKLYDVSLNTGTYYILKNVVLNNGTSQVSTKGNNILYVVYPDEWIETYTNKICDDIGITHIYPNVPNRWKWLYSSDTDTYSYAPSCMKAYPNHTVTVIVKQIHHNPNTSIDDNTLWTYVCNISTKTIRKNIYTQVSEDIIPDTIEEAVWNKAKTYYDSLE